MFDSSSLIKEEPDYFIYNFWVIFIPLFNDIDKKMFFFTFH